MKLESQLQVSTASGVAPFTVNQTALVSNLNAQYLGGQLGSYFEGRDTTAIGFSGGSITLTRTAGNISVSLDGRYLPLTGGTLTGALTGTSLTLSSLATLVNSAGSSYNENIRLPRAANGYVSVGLACDTSGSGSIAGQFNIVVYPTATSGGAFAIRANGTDALTMTTAGAVNIPTLSGTTGSFSGQITSTIATGTAPFSIASTTLVTNLNAQYLNGQLGTYYAAASSLSSYLPLTGGTLSGELLISYAAGRQRIVDGANTLVMGHWDAANVRIEAGGRPMYIVSYGGAISIGRSSGSNLVVDTSSVAYGGNTILHAGNYTSYPDATKLPLTGGTLTGAITVNGISDAVVVQTNGNAAQWYGRISVRNSTSDKSSFLGTYQGIAGVFAHNNALNAWTDLYVNTVDGTNGGTVRMSADVRIGGNAALHAATTSAPNLSIGGSSASCTGNAATATRASTIAYSTSIDKSSTDLNNETSTGFFRGVTMTNAPDTGWWWVMGQSHDNTGGAAAGWNHQLAIAYGAGNTYGQGTMMYRSRTGSVGYSSWSTVLTSANYNSYALPLTGGTLTGGLSGTTSYFSSDVTWTGYNSGNPRAARLGYSGGNYGSVSYGINYTPTTATHNYAFNDAVTRIDLADGIQVYSAAAAVAGTAVSWTTLLEATRGNGNLRWKGNTVLDSNNYNSFALPLGGGTMTGNIILPAAGYVGLSGGSTFGIGVLATNRNSGVFDTLESTGSDPLELNYYQGGSVKIGSGTYGSKALYAVGIYDNGNAVLHAGNLNISQFTNNSSYQYHRTDITSLSSSATNVVQPLGTFDGANITNAPTSGWYNYLSSTHGSYLSSLIANLHRTADWYVGYKEGPGGSPTNPTWYKLLHSGNYTSYPDATKLPLTGGTLSGALNGTTAAFSGAITQGGNQVLHAGNYTGYAVDNSKRIKTFFWDNLGAVATQARRYEIARIGIDIVNWNAVGMMEIELSENYWSKGLKKKYSIWYGYVNPKSGLVLTEMSGMGSNNFRVVIGSETQVSGNQYYLPIYVEAREYTQVAVRMTMGRLITTNSSPETGYTYIIAAPTGTDIADFGADSVVNISNAATGWQVGGNVVLHAGNVATYALPIGGGTLTGSITATDHIGPGTGLTGVANSLNIGGYSARWATGRTISLTGDVTGTSVAFDGTAALSFAATIANSSVTYAKIQNVAAASVIGNSSASVAQAPQALSMATLAGMLSGQTMNIAGSSTSCTGNATTATNGFTVKPGWAGNQNLIEEINNFNLSKPSGFYQGYNATNSPTTTTWYNLINVRHSNAGNDHGFQLTMRYYDEVLWSRSYQGGTGANDGTFTTWRAHLHSGNFNSYALPLTGGTLTGGLSGTTGAFSGTLAATGAITQNGNQVLHAGNVATYALPIGGGALTGALSVTGSVLTETAASSWGVYSKTSGVANYSGIWFSSNVGELLLRNAAGSLVTRIAADGSYAFINNNNILTAANYTSYPDTTKLPLTGGAITGNSTFSASNHLTFGPNTSWGRYLRIGGDGYTAPVTTTASVVTTNGNLHLDAAKAAGMGIYLNWYGGPDGVRFGNGSTSQVGYVDGSGNASFIGTLAITGAITQGGNQVLHAGNYTSYTLPRGGGWYGASLPGTRWGGFSVNGGEIVFGQDLPAVGQMGILIDGCYIAAENNGFWSLASSNDWTTRRGMYFDGTYLRFDYNSATAYFSNASIGGNQVLHAGNYTSYSPPLGGTGATGVWPISITGNASGSSASAGYLTGGDGNFYGILYNTTSGNLNLYNTPGLISAEYTGTTNNPTGSQSNGHFIQISDAGGTDVKTQWYYQFSGSDISMRLMWGNGSWLPWRKLLHDGNYGGYSTFSGVVSSASGGFQTATYVAGRNRIWTFGNADGYGINYYQGAGGISGNDVIGLNFGNATAALAQFQFLASGSLNATGTITATNFSGPGSNLTGTASSLTAGSANAIADGVVSTTAKLANSVVTYAKIQNVTAYTVLGNSSASAAQAPVEISMATLAGMVGSQYTTSVGNPFPDRVFMGTDANIKFASMALAKTHLGVSSKWTTSRAAQTSDVNYWTGSMGWGATDWNSVFDWGSGFTDSWSSPANNPGDTSHHVGVQAVHYTTGSARYGWQMVNGAATNRWWLRDIWGGGFSAWREIIHSGNIASQTVATAGSCTGNAASASSVAWTNVSGRPTAVSSFSNDSGYITSGGSISGSAGSVAASGITGQTGMWTSAARPGPYRLYRRDADDAYSVQTYWTGSYWRLDGYYSNNTVHAGCIVAYADAAASSASCSGNAASVTDGVYLSTNQYISGVKTFSSAPVATNIAKAWVHYNMNTNTINASYNVSSVTDNGTGVCTVNFATAMVDANYVVAGTATYGYDDQDIHALILAVPRRSTAQQAGSCRLATEYIHAAGVYDSVAVRAVFYR